MKTEDRKKLGKQTRKEGKEFEIRVRKDLSEKGWIVCRFDNDVKFPYEEKNIKNMPTPQEFKKMMNSEKFGNNEWSGGELVQAKTSWRRTPHGIFPMNLSPGFPDFICHRISVLLDNSGTRIIAPCIPSCNNDTFDYQLIGVECKISGTLDKLEKQKCQWYLDNNIFSKILIAKKLKIKNRIHIEYKEWN